MSNVKQSDYESLGELRYQIRRFLNVIVTYPDEVLQEASAKMLRNNIGRLPVVERNNPQRVVGYLGRPGVMAARLRRLDEEHVRDRG
jgi:CIC family chloride channel protein